uniref:Uncharacterized protein n=1 Tax=Avena sativa TaxID=4498 RepID=A0ACD5TSM9_AVESA
MTTVTFNRESQSIQASNSSTAQIMLEWILYDESAEPNALPFSLLEEITNGFSDYLEIGRGGYGVVYMGMLNHGDVVAVKRLFFAFKNNKAFQGEIGCLIKVKHKNIIRFLGYCADTEGYMVEYNGKLVRADRQEKLLCFEYLPKGSIEHYIKDSSVGLEWREWYKIIKGICEGLNYLHENNILHLDLKPTNILLDKDMNPKIIDFGQSRCLEKDQTHAIDTIVAATKGYLAPEYNSNKITPKFDLYSLGVIIMEILTGKKGCWVVENLFDTWSNRSDASQWKQIQVCAEIGMECIDFNPAKRPLSMKHIMDKLLETESTKITDIMPSELLVVRQFALCFLIKPKKVITCPLQLINNTNRHVAFQLMDKSGESFLRLPLYGIVLPGAQYTLSVTTQECKELPPKSNMDLILESAAILMDDYLNTFKIHPDIFFRKAKHTRNMVQEVTLKAFYTPRREKIDSSKSMLFEEGIEPKALPLSLLKEITDGFSNKLEIGRGGSAVVYKGMLDNGSTVAIKRMYSTLYDDKQFHTEVECLMKIKHKNIVRFLGYCADTKGSMLVQNGKLVMADTRERLLCFEYLPK